MSSRRGYDSLVMVLVLVPAGVDLEVVDGVFIVQKT